MTSPTMRAAAIDAFGPADLLTVREVPRPKVGPDDVLIRVAAAGVQVTDAAIRAGWTPPGATITFPQILGNECAGVVESIGAAVTGFYQGDAVLGFNMLHCYAEYVCVPQSQVVHKPTSVAWESAGALSASGQTAHTALEDLAVTAGDTVLVHGAAGGVGTIFTQLARRAGATVVGTASEENHDYLRNLGAIPVVYGTGQLGRIRAVTESIDVAFDAAGHENLLDAVELVRDRLRIATIVDMALAEDLGCRVVRSRRSAERLQELVTLVAAGDMRVHIRQAYRLEEAAAAHRDVESGHGRGKTVLQIGAPQ